MKFNKDKHKGLYRFTIIFFIFTNIMVLIKYFFIKSDLRPNYALITTSDKYDLFTSYDAFGLSHLFVQFLIGYAFFIALIIPIAGLYFTFKHLIFHHVPDISIKQVERNNNMSLRKQYLSIRGGLFSVSKFKSINCPHCEKAIVFSRYGTVCPYCDEKKFDLLGSLEEFLFDRCTTCRNVIKYFECPHCKEWITTDETLPQTNKVAYLQTDLSLQKTTELVVNELNSYGFNVEEKIVSFLNGLFHDFDMKNERRLTEKLEEAMKRNMLNYGMLDKMTDIKTKQSKNLTEQNRALLLQAGIERFPALSPILQTSLLINLFGSGESKLDNLNFDEEMKKQLVKIKKEEAISQQLENELKKWKLGQNINGL